MNLRINGRTLEAPDGSTMFQATRLADTEVPTLAEDALGHRLRRR